MTEVYLKRTHTHKHKTTADFGDAYRELCLFIVAEVKWRNYSFSLKGNSFADAKEPGGLSL